MKTKRFALLALALVMCLTITAFAAPSKTEAVEVAGAVDANNAPVAITVSDTTVPVLTEEVAGNVAVVDGDELTVLWQKDITAETLPVTLTFHVDGTAGVMLYVYHFNGTEWELIASGEGEDVEATFTSLSPVAIAGETSTADPGDVSPVTGDSTAICVAAFGAMMIVGAACIAFRKKSHS